MTTNSLKSTATPVGSKSHEVQGASKAGKRTIPGELFLVLGMLLNSLAVPLMIKANFGISPVSSFPYVLSLAFPVISLGAWNAVTQTAWLIITMLIIRKFKPGYIFSFGLSFVFAFLMDFWTALIAPWSMELLPRIGYFAAGFSIMAVGITAFFLCGTPVLPPDTAPRAIVLEKGLQVRTVRTLFDSTNVLLAIAVGLSFLGRVAGIGIGTVFGALFMGTAVGVVNKWVTARFNIKPYFSSLGKLV